jgi:peptidoglycan/LPS O-acetylase OafA/YrhL
MKVAKNSTYDAGIDVVRFIAFLCVFIHHFVYRGGNSIAEAPKTFWANIYVDSFAFFGSEGVTIFFCLSGYLLSKLLIRELDETGRLSIRSFYLRRILRIWPLYFSFIVFCILAAPILGNQAIKSSELPSLLTFTYNWQQIYVGQSRGMPAILWSISVEEQIYLILPLLLILFFRWGVKKLAIALVLLGYFSRCLLYINEASLYRNTFSYMSTIGIGMFYAIYEESIRRSFQRNRILFSFIFTSLIVIYVLQFKSIFSKGSLAIVVFDLTAIMAIFLLVMLGRSQAKLSRAILRPFAWLGRRTYGMYIFHWPILALMVSRNVFFDDLTGISYEGLVFAFGLVVGISAFSYRYFEKPFLDLRKKYQYIKIG